MRRHHRPLRPATTLGTLAGLPAEGSPIVSGFTRSGHQVMVYATAAVVPLTGKIAAPRGPTRLLVIARHVDEAFLADLTRELNVHDVLGDVSRVICQIKKHYKTNGF